MGHNEPFDGDVDVFSFAVEQDALYEVRLTEIATGFTTELTLVNATGNGVPTIQSEGWHKLFRAASGETLFARVSSPGGYGTYRVSVREFENERGDTSSSVIALVPGAPPVNAGFDHPSDMDWYSFPATEGEYYVVKVWEPSSYPSNEQWSELELYDTDRVTRLSWATAGIAGTLLPFQPSHTGVYFIRARHTITQANPYEISVGSPIADDHGDVGQPTLLPLDGSPVAGNIEPWVDRDVFALDLAQGQTVTIEVTPLEEGHDTRMSVWKPDLINQLGADDDGNGGFAPRVTFTAPASARYFAILSSWPLSSGRDRYTISARIE